MSRRVLEFPLKRANFQLEFRAALEALSYGSLGSRKSMSQFPNGISIGFRRATVVTNRHTDRPRYSACSSRPHSHAVRMRCTVVVLRVDSLMSVF